MSVYSDPSGVFILFEFSLFVSVLSETPVEWCGSDFSDPRHAQWF